MEFRILGPVEVLDEGSNIVPTAPKPRQVISLLMLRRNGVVRTDEFIDELWEGGPPTSAMTTLQTYIYKLRKILLERSAEEMLSTRPGGYTLSIPDSSIDLHRFERDAAAGQARLESGDPAEAARTLKGALAMWRGQALADIELGPLLSSYATRLGEQRSRALELRIDADLRLGRHRELISELKSLVLTQPLHEHLHISLMIALYRSGRRHEALETYRTLHANMIEELGLEPSRELKELHQALLSDTPPGGPYEPEPSGEPGSIRLSAAVKAAGSAFVLPSEPVSAERADPPAASVPAPRSIAEGTAGRTAPENSGGERMEPATTAPSSRNPAQLPPDVADFTGRDALIDELAGVLAPDDACTRTATPIAVISGLPGTGKTALAIHLGHLLHPRFRDGQLYVDLHGSIGSPRGPAEVLGGFLRALGVTESDVPDGAEERGALFRSMTSDHRLLIVLDDVPSPGVVRALLPAASRCAVLATGRRRLHGPAGAHPAALGPLTAAESTELLARMIGRARLEVAPRAAERLVALSDGLPLALRCVGSRLAAIPGLPLDEQAERLSQSPLDLLCLNDLNVRAGYKWIYNGLGRLEQGLFRLLSMLPPEGFTVGAAAGLLGWEPSSVWRVLERFVDDHVVTDETGDDGEIHYRFPPLAWAYAREKLDSTIISSPEEAAAGSGQVLEHPVSATSLPDREREGFELLARPGPGPVLHRAEDERISYGRRVS